MEEKSILIQSDEVTKNIMNEIQDDMINALSKVSRNMSEDVIEKIKPIERRINELKGSFQEFQEDEFKEKIEELNNSILKISKSIENTIEATIKRSVAEKNTELFKLVEERLAILGLKIVKDAGSNRDSILNKIETIDFNKIEEKLDSTKSSIECKTEMLEKSIEDNVAKGKELILEKIKAVDSKIEEKDALIELITKLENNINEKIENMQEEVEWGNKSIFSRIFGKRR